MATGRNALLARPQWVINNQLTLPLITIADDGKQSVRGLVGILVPITIFLDTLFKDQRLAPGARPRSEGAVYDAFLDDYRHAEKLGRSENVTCSTSFRECSVSVFDLFQQQYSTIDDKPVGGVDESYAGDDNHATSDEERINEHFDHESLLAGKYHAKNQQDVRVDGLNHLS